MTAGAEAAANGAKATATATAVAAAIAAAIARVDQCISMAAQSSGNFHFLAQLSSVGKVVHVQKFG